MSGRYPAETGVDHNGPSLPIDTVSLGETFRRNGYHTGYVGKWHLNGPELGFIPKGPKRFGFEDWHVWDQTNEHYHSWTFDPDTGEKIQPEGYSASHMTDQAVTFIKEQTTEKPWFLVLSWNPPHPPFNPPKQDRKPYPLDTLKARPNVQLASPGVHLDKTREPLNSIDDLRQAQQGYYGGITAIDLEFARVLKALDESGHAENTIVIYTSDHGEMMGSHGHMAKQMPHEESCRVPFFIRTPGVSPKSHTSDILFASIDIYPSLCGLASVPVPSHCRGRDLSAALRGQQTSSPDHVFLTNQMKPNSPEQFTPTYRGLRTATHTYAVTEAGRWLLYDNVADPYQTKNLIKDPAHAALIAKFDAAVEDWMATTGDKFPYKNALKSYADYTDYPVA
jgi:arylsulfatase A-like enzyme